MGAWKRPGGADRMELVFLTARKNLSIVFLAFPREARLHSKALDTSRLLDDYHCQACAAPGVKSRRPSHGAWRIKRP
jgi:hypothetical protein